jgi:hypothetical protein
MFYRFYHTKIKRPLCRIHITTRKHIRKIEIAAKSDSVEEERKKLLTIMHAESIRHSDSSDDPHSRTPLLPFEEKLELCNKKIDQIRDRVKTYSRYTKNHIKREDLYELCIYIREKNQLSSLNTKKQSLILLPSID